jgi:signal transduction histidine kinase
VPLRAEGDEAVNLVVTSFVSDEPGRSLLVVAEDVTEDLRTKARLIQTERLAAIGRMAAHVTHEVRNPLSSIGLNVEMLGDEIGSSPEARALLGAIEREIDRLTNITQEYLRLARLPDPRLELEDLGAVVDSVGRFVLPEMVEAKIELLVRVEEGLPAVAIDEGQVRQALLNLLRNAREAMPEGGRVDLEAVRADGGVRVSVRDRGPGIEPEIRARIFDLFYTTKERGTGLGLPLTYQIVTAHGGRIECNSDPDDGTTFELWFPPVIEPSRSEVSAAE